MKKLICTALLFLSSPVFAASSLNAIMTTQNLGQPLNNLGLGVSKESGYLTHEYTIGGCALEVEVKNDEFKTIVALSIPASTKCQTAQLSDVLGAKTLPPFSTLTFGQLSGLLGPARYTADCLTLCGNAYNPSVAARWGSLWAEVVLVDGPAIDASMRWEKAINSKYGEDYVVDNRFNCTQEFDAQAAHEFKNVKVTHLTLRKPTLFTECKNK